MKPSVALLLHGAFMVFAYLTRCYFVRCKQLGPLSWLLAILRSIPVLLYYRDHAALCALDVYRNYVMRVPIDCPFRHLCSRGYLVKGLSTRERVRCALSHYQFEDTVFDAAYKVAVYTADGLSLWQQTVGGNVFSIRLEMAAPASAEGDLTIALVAQNKVLHRLTFSWVEGGSVGIPEPFVALIARNHGHWTGSGEAFTTFDRYFPNNSPSYFCFAALQGLVQELGMKQVVAVNYAAHVGSDPQEEKQLANAYDGFWKILGGIKLPSNAWLVQLPFYLKPMIEIRSKHRKRTAQRREHWHVIGESARAALQRHVLNAPSMLTNVPQVYETVDA